MVMMMTTIIYDNSEDDDDGSGDDYDDDDHDHDHESLEFLTSAQQEKTGTPRRL